MRRRRRTTEHENGLEKSAAISYHSFDGQPSFSLGTDVVDPLTMSLLSSAKSLGLVLCTREAHLFSEQTRRTRRQNTTQILLKLKRSGSSARLGVAISVSLRSH